MKRTLWTVILLLILHQSSLFSQKKWTLEDCISYAITNNIQLKRQKLQTETDKIYLLKSKMDVLPDLSFSSSGRLGFGRSIDPVTNLITFKQNLSNSYTLSSNITLFNGFATMNTIAANKFMLKAGIETEKVAKNSLIIDILGGFYQVMYAKGLEENARMQLELSEKQLFRVTKSVETGKESLSKQYELESKVSDDRLAYTIAKNTSSQALTTLKQMLQLEPGSEFDIFMPDLDNVLITNESFRADSIYSIASETLPRLKAINYELIANKKQLASAKGYLFPGLYAGGSIFTGYYKVIGEDDNSQNSFRQQLKNNNSQAIFISLSIPLFNNYSTGRNIRLAKIRQTDTELKLQQEKNSLYTEIENACLNISRGNDEYVAAASSLEYNKKSFESVEKKFEAGLVDVTDYSAANTALFKAETETLRTKLQLLIRKLTIQFYTTGEYEKVILN